ncbi:MAG: hypothetical protein GYB65_22505 [Chloroflexi bacterium]|nr:hypothetical protein [Chloroflexota bacterium]
MLLPTPYLPSSRAIWPGLLIALLLLAGTQPALAGPVEPDYLPLIGKPAQLAVFWHDQRWTPGDEYACALYAQASVMEAMGYNFARELETMRSLGQRDNWYNPQTGTIGLGQPFLAKGIAYQSFGSPVDDTLTHERALYRLQRELSAGQYVIVNINAQLLSYYRGSAITWHTLWITGMRFDGQGTATHVIANDSYHGPAVEYPIDEFLNAWASEFNYYGIFIQNHVGET